MSAWLIRAAGYACALPVVLAAAEHWTRRSRRDDAWATFGAVFAAAVLVGIYAATQVAVR